MMRPETGYFGVERFCGRGVHQWLRSYHPIFFLIGIAKSAGVIAMSLPVSPEIKELRYAGFTFGVFGATYGMIAGGGTTASGVS